MATVTIYLIRMLVCLNQLFALGAPSHNTKNLDFKILGPHMVHGGNKPHSSAPRPQFSNGHRIWKLLVGISKFCIHQKLDEVVNVMFKKQSLEPSKVGTLIVTRTHVPLDGHET